MEGARDYHAGVYRAPADYNRAEHASWARGRHDANLGMASASPAVVAVWLAAVRIRTN